GSQSWGQVSACARLFPAPRCRATARGEWSGLLPPVLLSGEAPRFPGSARQRPGPPARLRPVLPPSATLERSAALAVGRSLRRKRPRHGANLFLSLASRAERYGAGWRSPATASGWP